MKTAPKTESMTPIGRISTPGPGFSAVVAGHTSPHSRISGSRLPQASLQAPSATHGRYGAANQRNRT